MSKTVYEDYKYCMQDVGTVYIGTKYTFQELLDSDTVPFKFQLLVERYIIPEADLEDSLESHLYYLPEKSFLVKIYEQLKMKVKINIIEEKKSLTGKSKKEYTTKVVPIRTLVQMSVADKETAGVVVLREFITHQAMQRKKECTPGFTTREVFPPVWYAVR